MKYTVFLLGILFMTSCKKQIDVACTMEWRSLQINVVGAVLDDHFTIRLATGDTLRFSSDPIGNATTYYTILDDSYQPALANRTENFRFVGVIEHEIVVDEAFVISADECHIDYVSGNLSVTL